MDEKRTEFDAIIRGIRAGLTGDADHDKRYLGEQMQKYKTHEFGKEIVRECGRILCEYIPDDVKEEFAQKIDGEDFGVSKKLEGVRFSIYKKDYGKALSQIEELAAHLEEIDMFRDDMVSTYRCFGEPFEEVLYSFLAKPAKDLRQSPINYYEVYYLYGALLVEMKQFEKAKEVLKKASRWNPIGSDANFEYNEIFKMTGDMETFFRRTVATFRVAFRAKSMARLYRDLGYYFIEKGLYEVAAACYYMSLSFEPDSKQAMSELYYISEKTGGKSGQPAYEELERYSKQYGFPLGPDDDVIGIAYANGKHFFEEGANDLAEYFFTIVYELTNNEGVGKILEQIRQKMS